MGESVVTGQGRWRGSGSWSEEGTRIRLGLCKSTQCVQVFVQETLCSCFRSTGVIKLIQKSILLNKISSSSNQFKEGKLDLYL